MSPLNHIEPSSLSAKFYRKEHFYIHEPLIIIKQQAYENLLGKS